MNTKNHTYFTAKRLKFFFLCLLFLSNSIHLYSQCGNDFTDWSDQNITMTVGDGSLPFGVVIDCITVANQDCPSESGKITIEWSLLDPINNPFPSGPTDFFRFNLYDAITNNIVSSSTFFSSPATNGVADFSAAPNDYYIEFSAVVPPPPPGVLGTLEYNQILTVNDEGNTQVEVISYNIESPGCPGIPGRIEVVLNGGSSLPDYYIEIAGGAQLSNTPTNNDADDIYNNVFFPPNSTDPNDYLITFTVGDNNIEDGCTETFQVQFDPPEIEETEITITHESCPGEADGSIEVTFDNEDGFFHIFTLYDINDTDPNNISISQSDVSFYNGTGLGNVPFSPGAPNIFAFNGIGEPDGRPFSMIGDYTSILGSCNYFEIANNPPYDDINEPQPLLLYTLEEPVIDLNDVTLTQPLCFEQNGSVNPDVDPFSTGDDDAGGIISFPISSLSGTENLNAVFGLDYGPEYWNFVLIQDGAIIETIQATDTNSDGVIDDDDEIIFDELEEGLIATNSEYYIYIEYPSVDITTTIQNPGDNRTYSGSISNSTFCTSIDFGPFELTEPEEILFDVVGNDDLILCPDQALGFPELNLPGFTTPNGGTPFTDDTGLNFPIEGSPNEFYELHVYNNQNAGSEVANPYELTGGPAPNPELYWVTLSDANGCESLPIQIEIFEPEEIDLNDPNIFQYTLKEF